MIIGEVVNVESLTEFQIQQIEGGDEVQLGRFVIDEKYGIFGVLGDIHILNPNLGTYPRPKRLPMDVELKAIYPDLIEQFPTIIDVYVLGYMNDDKFIQDIPFRPPQMYSKIRFATDEEIKEFHTLPENDQPYINYLIRLQNNSHPVIDTMIRIMFNKLVECMDISIDEILEMMQ